MSPGSSAAIQALFPHMKKAKSLGFLEGGCALPGGAAAAISKPVSLLCSLALGRQGRQGHRHKWPLLRADAVDCRGDVGDVIWP